jgi:antitoxin component YwqK of YwqJK toxin-antitoxin module
VLAVFAGTNLGCSRSNPCPEGARLHGRAPPAGTLEWCAKSDGQKHGRWTEWFPGGKIKSEGRFADGEMEGLWVSYFETGVKQLEGTYRGGLKQDLWTLYYEEGQKNRQEIHAAGSPDVKWVAWRQSGMKWAEGTLRGQRAQGPYSEWHPNGTLAIRGQYESGEKVGGWTYADADGKPSGAPQGDFASE